MSKNIGAAAKVARLTDEELIEAAGYRCQCDGAAGREACTSAHATAPARRCGRIIGLSVRIEPDGTKAVVCDRCTTSRISALRKPKARAKPKQVGAQLDLFSVLYDPDQQ